eukprot:TRINITY_DN15189_c0_g1_i2.p1 TRINITY_DN15189_c0_g1~~TRINITY_DN15189_c0_g1_i2.p1  ORF type:complete len:787 (+),score=239.10 TRINITY_DN15189_c0_g1_i2:50-2362(+)
MASAAQQPSLGSSPRRRPKPRKLGDMHVSIGFKALSMMRMRVTSFERFGPQPELEYMYLQGNLLDSMEHFGCQPNLKELHLDHNNLRSFAGLSRQPKLEVLRMAGNPVAAEPYYREMALLAAGLQLRRVDETAVSQREREAARRLGDACAYAVSCGWLLPDLRKRSAAEYLSIAEECRRELAPGEPPIAPPPLTATPNGDAGLPLPARSVSEASSGMHPPSAVLRPTIPPPLHREDDEVELLAPGRWQHHRRGRSASGSGGGSASPREPSPSEAAAAVLDAERLRRHPPQHTASDADRGRVTSGRSVSAAGTETLFGAGPAVLQQNAGLHRVLEEVRGELTRERVRCQTLLKERALATDLGNNGLSFDEIEAVAAYVFGGGLSLSSTQPLATPGRIGTDAPASGAPARIANACVTVDSTHMLLSHYFDRRRAGEVALADLADVTLSIPNQEVSIRTKHGASLRVQSECPKKCLALYKVLHFRIGRLPPLYEPRFAPPPVEQVLREKEQESEELQRRQAHGVTSTIAEVREPAAAREAAAAAPPPDVAAPAAAAISAPALTTPVDEVAEPLPAAVQQQPETVEPTPAPDSAAADPPPPRGVGGITDTRRWAGRWVGNWYGGGRGQPLTQPVVIAADGTFTVPGKVSRGTVSAAPPELCSDGADTLVLSDGATAALFCFHGAFAFGVPGAEGPKPSHASREFTLRREEPGGGGRGAGRGRGGGRGAPPPLVAAPAGVAPAPSSSGSTASDDEMESSTAAAVAALKAQLGLRE